MSRYQEQFEQKTISIESAVDLIQSDMDLVVAQCASEPQGVMAQFHLAGNRVKNVNVFSVLTLGAYQFYIDPKMKGHFKLCSWFHSTHSRRAIKERTGTVTFVPNMLHRAATDRLSVRDPNIFFGTCTPPDDKGFVSLSLGITYEKEILERAGLVILEVNEKLPRTFGDTHLRVDQVDHFVIHNQEVPALPEVAPNEVERTIGEHIASLVEDGSTIQLGIGGIPNAAAMALKGKKDLGVHTEMMVDSMMELYELGVVTNKRKTLYKDKFLCTFAMGSRKLYDWLDNNMAVEFRRGSWVNDPAVIRQNAKMTSINTCLAIDFTGQVSSESVGIHQYSGTGGQTDTAVGAKECYDGKGKSIIACRSTAKGGTLSTIVPTLQNGSAVTLHRSNSDYIVTEWGVASLRGRTIEERTRALIKIAHPDFREDLTKQALDMGFILD
jgi:acyl-CoA hydrolase